MAKPLPSVPQALNHEVAEAYVRQCRDMLEASAPSTDALWLLDASGLRDFDSSALAALLAIRRQVHARGECLQLQSVPPRLQELAALYGLSALLPA